MTQKKTKRLDDVNQEHLKFEASNFGKPDYFKTLVFFSFVLIILMESWETYQTNLHY